jgi:Serine/threonine protein kinase
LWLTLVSFDADDFYPPHSIIYRDLKPDNIGFDVRDDVKIFDFGLAAEMHPSLRIEGTNTYNLTAESGSPRYMAPEVALGQPYNQLADVYSFSILLWEMCTMKTPFSGYDFETLNKKVFKGSHRPELNSKWNKPLRDVMEKCWSRRISNRLECDEIMTILSEEIMTVYGGDGNILDCMNASSKTEASVVRRAIR